MAQATTTQLSGVAFLLTARPAAATQPLTSFLSSNVIGNNNTAVGRDALLGNTTGESNVVVGRGALANNTTGDSNLGLGIDAGNPDHHDR
jgi:hypothetical protein